MKIKKSKEAKKSSKTITKPKRNFTAIAVTGASLVLLFGGIAYSLTKLLENDSFYVVNTDIPARTQITEGMLVKHDTAKGTAPKNAISIADVQQGSVFAKYPIFEGDIVSTSNTGQSTSGNDGIPDGWTVMTIAVSSDNAVNGTLARGDYFDIVSVSTAQGKEKGAKAKYVALNVLALDVASSSVSQSDENGDLIKGTNLLFTVGLPPEYALAVQAEMSSGADISFLRSPMTSLYEDRDIEEVTGALSGIGDGGDTLPLDKFNEGTDATFAPVIRDQNLRPVNEKNCSEGNIEPQELCSINGF